MVTRQTERLDLIDGLDDASQRRAPLLTIATVYLERSGTSSLRAPGEAASVSPELSSRLGPPRLAAARQKTFHFLHLSLASVTYNFNFWRGLELIPSSTSHSLILVPITSGWSSCK